MTVALLADYSRDDVLDADHPLVYFATVGTFNQKDKQDGTLGSSRARSTQWSSRPGMR